MTLLTLDIETLPTNNAEIIAEFAKTITAPGQYKKQDSIDAWLAENRESALKELVAKTSFDGLYGRIACICWSFDDGEIYATSPDDTEADTLNKLYDSVRHHVSLPYNGGVPAQNLTICGHNVAGFDLPFLKHRSIVLDIKPPPDIINTMSAKQWDKCIADTMLMWDAKKMVSMDKLCKALDIQGKGDFNGSMVADTWLTDPAKVIEYCKDDVRRTSAIYQRLTWKC